ncbi:unnamed protein product [Hymenolepis diminuta]|uniref:UspA domain-containing protein n=1 Tax=Hymenolepis diminuta TaxID=6216 RepID=A0A564YF91_HYMDI|nr:unnamed protein product [Hymenolepis diminuta]
MSNEPIGRRIVIAVDGSSNCQRAFNWYVKYIYRKNDFVFFAHVMQPKSSHRNMVLTVVLAQTVHDFSLDFTDTGAISDSYKKLAEIAGVTDFKTEILANTSVGEAVLSLAADLQANLVVIGCRGSVATALGESTYEVIVNSKIPVLVVPSEETDDQNCFI